MTITSPDSVTDLGMPQEPAKHSAVSIPEEAKKLRLTRYHNELAILFLSTILSNGRRIVDVKPPRSHPIRTARDLRVVGGGDQPSRN